MMGAADITDRIQPGCPKQESGELSQEIVQLNKEWRAKRDNYRNSQSKESAAQPLAAATHTESAELGDNGLAEAASSGRVQDCQRILQHTGPNVWAKDGTTPLCAAALWGQADTLRLLLDAAADPGQCNRSGLRPTALHAAALQEHGKICMVLLAARADPYAKDSAGVTPTDYASCSEAVWPHFAGIGCSRTPKEDLIRMGVIRKASSTLELELGGSYDGYSDKFQSSTGNTGVLKEFSRPGSAYVVTAHHPPRPGSAAVSAYGRPGSRRSSMQPIDILAEGDEANEVAASRVVTSCRSSVVQPAPAPSTCIAPTGTLRSLGL
jgi:hypothetical protein